MKFHLSYKKCSRWKLNHPHCPNKTWQSSIDCTFTLPNLTSIDFINQHLSWAIQNKRFVILTHQVKCLLYLVLTGIFRNTKNSVVVSLSRRRQCWNNTTSRKGKPNEKTSTYKTSQITNINKNNTIHVRFNQTCGMEITISKRYSRNQRLLCFRDETATDQSWYAEHLIPYKKYRKTNHYAKKKRNSKRAPSQQKRLASRQEFAEWWFSFIHEQFWGHRRKQMAPILHWKNR